MEFGQSEKVGTRMMIDCIVFQTDPHATTTESVDGNAKNYIYIQSLCCGLCFAKCNDTRVWHCLDCKGTTAIYRFT